MLCSGREDNLQDIGLVTAKVRKLATREGVRVRSLVERGLHLIIMEPKLKTPFKLRRAAFNGYGLQREVRDSSWGQIGIVAYSGRGA